MDFLQFVSEIILNYSPPGFSDYSGIREVDLQQDLNTISKDLSGPLAAYAPVLESWKFFVQFVLTVLLRVRDESSVPLFQVLKSLKNVLSKDVGLSMWLVDTFTEEQILEEFFVHCPTGFSRFFALSLLLTACKTLYLSKEKEALQVPETYLSPLKEGELIGESKQLRLRPKHNVPLLFILINNIIRLLPALTCHKRLRDLSLFLTLACRIGPEIKKLLLVGGMLGFALEKLLSLPSGPFTTALSGLSLVTMQRGTLALGTQTTFEVSKGESRVAPLTCKNKVKSLRFLVDLMAEVFPSLVDSL